MYTETTEGFNSIISGSSRHFYCKLSRDGEELTTGFFNVKITQQANPETDSFTIGGTVATVVEVEMKKPNSMLTGKEFQLSFGLEVDGEVEWCPMCVVTAEKPKEDSGLITFTAYDRMVTALNYPYYTDITSYPVDAKVILREISTKSGISIANLDSLPDGIYAHQIAVENEDTGTYTAKNPFAGCTYREAVKYLAQLYGTFATMNRTGELEFRWYTNTDYTIELNRSMDDVVLNEEEYEVQRIICAAGKAAIPGTDSGFVLHKFHSPVSVDKDGILSVGNGTTGITMENPAMDVSIMEKVWAKIGGFKFTPITVSFLGDCRLDLGDIVTVKTRDGSLELPVMGMEFGFDGGLSTEIGSYGSTEMQEASSFTGNSDKIVDYVNSEILRVNELLANKVNTKYLEANYATIKELDVVNARIDSVTSTDITVEYLETHYAQIDMENVDTAVIRKGFLENLMVSQGIIADRIVGEEVVATDVLTGVNIYADDITAGTLSVDRLVLRGTDKSLVYALNNSGELVSTQVDTLDAYILTERTITADKIVAESITANEMAASAITAKKIASNAVTASKVEAGAITSVKIQAGAITSDKIQAGAVTADKITVDSLEAIVAKIGGFTINSNAIYKGTDSKSSTVSGIYLGTDAIRAYSGASAYTHIENGVLSCVGANIKGAISATSLDIARKITFDDNGMASATMGFIGDDRPNPLEIFGNYSYVSIRGPVNIVSDSDHDGSLSATTIYTSNWFRSTGKTGWYNQTYGGGIYMEDTTWVRVFNNKSFLVNNQIRATGEIQSTSTNGYRITQGGKSTFWRNDGSSLYLMMSDSEYGDFNSLRPFTVNQSTGLVTMLNSLKVANGIFWWDGSYDRRVVYTHNNGVYSLASNAGYLELSTNQGAKGINWWDSDARLKKNIESTTENALEIINKIQHYSFDWKDENHKSIKVGYVAQQLEEIEELFVLKVDQTHISEENECEYDYTLQVDETHIIPYITKAIQELSAQVEELKNQIATM